MHELAAAAGVVRIAVREAEANGVKRVLRVNVRLGEFSDVLPGYLETCFTLAAEGTAVQGASLCILRVPARVLCRDCLRESTLEKRHIACPVCGGGNLKLLSGTECAVESIEVE